jgi:hypothetical protein
MVHTDQDVWSKNAWYAAFTPAHTPIVPQVTQSTVLPGIGTMFRPLLTRPNESKKRLDGKETLQSQRKRTVRIFQLSLVLALILILCPRPFIWGSPAKYNDNPASYWDRFYKWNEGNFFRDRKWLHQEFPELTQLTDSEVCAFKTRT